LDIGREQHNQGSPKGAGKEGEKLGGQNNFERERPAEGRFRQKRKRRKTTYSPKNRPIGGNAREEKNVLNTHYVPGKEHHEKISWVEGPSSN